MPYAPELQNPQQSGWRYPVPVPSDVATLRRTLRLRNEQSVTIRAINPQDVDRLRRFHESLSMDTIVFRFFRVVPVLSDEDAFRFTHVDYENRMAMVATVGSGADESIVAVVRYDRTGAESAEVAFVVADKWQGLGIAPTILCDLAAYARKRGIGRLVAITMGSNMHMLDMLRHCGFPVSMRYVDGDVEGTLDISGASPA